MFKSFPLEMALALCKSPVTVTFNYIEHNALMWKSLSKITAKH